MEKRDGRAGEIIPMPFPHRALPFGWRPHSFALRALQSNCVRTSPEGYDLEKKRMVGPARLSRCPSPHRALPFGWRPHSFALRALQSNCVRTSPEGYDLEKKRMVGPARFELAASSSRTRRSTKLSHGPTNSYERPLRSSSSGTHYALIEIQSKQFKRSLEAEHHRIYRGPSNQQLMRWSYFLPSGRFRLIVRSSWSDARVDVRPDLRAVMIRFFSRERAH